MLILRLDSSLGGTSVPLKNTSMKHKSASHEPQNTRINLGCTCDLTRTYLHMEPYMYRDFKRLVGSRNFIYQMNAPIGYAVIGHTSKAVEFYEDGQEYRTGRWKLV